jgi:hypothetical protein
LGSSRSNLMSGGSGSSMAAPGVVPLLHPADFLHRRDQARTVFHDEL